MYLNVATYLDVMAPISDQFSTTKHPLKFTSGEKSGKNENGAFLVRNFVIIWKLNIAKRVLSRYN